LTKGYLKKQGEGWAVWRRRWFILRDNNLYYYKEEQGSLHNDRRSRQAALLQPENSYPIGHIDLRDAITIGHYVDDTSTPLPDDVPDPSPGDKPTPQTGAETTSAGGGGVLGMTLPLSLGRAFSLPTLWDSSRYFFIKSVDRTYWFFAGSHSSEKLEINKFNQLTPKQQQSIQQAARNK
jgi:hypothetical protein